MKSAVKYIELRDSDTHGNAGVHQGTEHYSAPPRPQCYTGRRGMALTPRLQQMVDAGVLPQVAALVWDRLDATDVAAVAARATGEQQWDEALTRITRRAMEWAEGEADG